ncbi:MAG: VCBS repeat-containing protein, partial [Kiritimatiellota bacterium]|nr:VCBS repeat-containing protein [Kiritimatiellota bacterium]
TLLQMALTDHEGGSWTNFDTGASSAGGGSGLNIVCNGPSNAYEVYFGWVVNTNKGTGTNWAQLPRGGFRPNATHVNAGCVKVDPLNTNTIYVTTDKGIGGSTNAGVDVVELNNGLLAFQINDIDALSDKSVAWIGSKAGMRRAANFNTTPVWTDGEFPDAIVYACAIDSDDPSGMTGYAGSSRLYKTTTGGGSNVSSWVSVFRWEDYGLTDGEMAAVKAKGRQVVLGYYSYSQGSPSGGVFVSSNGGSNWTAAITNIDVHDIIIRDEGGAGVIYAAVSKGKAGDRGGIYRIEGSSVVMDMTNEVNIRKLAEDSSGGIYASGTLPDTSEPGRHRIVAYYRADNVSGWEQLTTNGLPAGLWEGYVIGRVGGPPVITVGKDSATNDVPVLAVLRTIYYLPYGGSSWVTVANYPNGTQIKALFWDELMVGTTIGLYGQSLPVSSPASVVTGDFDADGKADPVVVAANGVWKIWMSSADYAPVSTIPLYVAGGTPVAGDFDNDGKADPCMVNASGVWKIWMSSADYAPVSTTPLYVAGGTSVAGDFDNDGKADPAMVDANGVWKIWMSSADYAPVTTIPLVP